MLRDDHPAVRFVPLVNAPASPVSLAFLPRDQHALIRRFVEAALEAAAAKSSVHLAP